MVCDGSQRVDDILRSAMLWDVMGGVARRAWARNPNAMTTVDKFNKNILKIIAYNAILGG